MIEKVAEFNIYDQVYDTVRQAIDKINELVYAVNDIREYKGKHRSED